MRLWNYYKKRHVSGGKEGRGKGEGKRLGVGKDFNIFFFSFFFFSVSFGANRTPLEFKVHKNTGKQSLFKESQNICPPLSGRMDRVEHDLEQALNLVEKVSGEGRRGKGRKRGGRFAFFFLLIFPFFLPSFIA